MVILNKMMTLDIHFEFNRIVKKIIKKSLNKTKQNKKDK